MSTLTVRLLGSPQVALDGKTIRIDTRKAIALFAYLALERQAQRRSTLSVLLWPESDRERGRSALRRTLAAFNKAAGHQWLVTDRKTIRLNWEAVESGELIVDVVQFQETFDQLIEAPLEQSNGEMLVAAVELYHGRFLQGFTLTDSAAFDDWQALEAERIEQQVGKLYGRLVAWALRYDSAENATRYAREWISLDALNEEGQRQLITALARSGQRSAAVRQYETFVKLLDHELGVPPRDETVELYHSVRDNYVPPPTIDPILRPTTLPQPTTLFVGRDQEMHDIATMLQRADCRLATIIGVGGVGKTRLATEIGLAMQSQWNDGVYFVGLASVESGNTIDDLVVAIANALDFTFYGRNLNAAQRHRQLLNFLGNKQALLLLDNLEHLSNAEQLVADILQHAPQLNILTTSQERLNLQEEWVIELPGLKTPTVETLRDSSVYQLFVERARQVRRGYLLAETDYGYLVQLCRLVGGLPLGIELASTWVRLLSLVEIVAQIEQDIDFLATETRNVPSRHRSLRAVFNHSWRLLTAREREMMLRLAVFRAPFTREAAKEVAGANLPLLMTLADKSLITRNATGVYEIPAVLLAYLREQGGDSDTYKRTLLSHAEYFAAFLQEQEAVLKGRDQQEALLEIGRISPDIRNAWQTLLDNQMLDAVECALPTLYLYYEMRGLFEEGVALIKQAREMMPIAESRIIGQLMATEGTLRCYLNQYELAEKLLQESLTLLRNASLDTHTALALRGLGMVAEAKGAHDEALRFHEQSLALYRQRENEWGMAAVSMAMGNVQLLQGKHEAARANYEESLTIRRLMGDIQGEGRCYHNLGHIQHALGNFDEAMALYQQSVELKKLSGAQHGLALTLNNMGHIACLQGNYVTAEQLLNESNALLDRVGDQRGRGFSITNLGSVALGRGDAQVAFDLYSESHRLFDAIGDPFSLALIHVHLGRAIYKLGDRADALQHLQSGIKQAHEIGANMIILEGLLAIVDIVKEEPAYLQFSADVMGTAQTHPELSAEGHIKWRELAEIVTSSTKTVPISQLYDVAVTIS